MIKAILSVLHYRVQLPSETFLDRIEDRPTVNCPSSLTLPSTIWHFFPMSYVRPQNLHLSCSLQRVLVMSKVYLIDPRCRRRATNKCFIVCVPSTDCGGSWRYSTVHEQSCSYFTSTNIICNALQRTLTLKVYCAVTMIYNRYHSLPSCLRMTFLFWPSTFNRQMGGSTTVYISPKGLAS